MAIGFRAASTNTTYTAVTTVTLSAPAGVLATDVILAVFGSTGLARSSLPSITAPAGWTIVKVQQDATNFGDLSVFRALGTVNFANAFTIGNGANVSGSCFSLAYTGVDNTTPMDATAVGQNNATSTTETAPSIITATANAWLVGAYLWFASAGALPTYSLEFGTHRLNGGLSAGRGGSTSVDTCDLLKAATGASGTKTVTVSATAVSSGILIALKASTSTTFNDSISESATASDALVTLQVAVAQLTESTTATDSVDSQQVLVVIISESANATDSIDIPGAGTVFSVDLSESANASDSVTALQVLVGSVTISTQAQDQTAALQTLIASVVESLQAQDQSATVQVLVVGVSALATAVDLTDSAAILNALYSDSAIPRDTYTYPAAAGGATTIYAIFVFDDY